MNEESDELIIHIPLPLVVALQFVNVTSVNATVDGDIQLPPSIYTPPPDSDALHFVKFNDDNVSL